METTDTTEIDPDQKIQSPGAQTPGRLQPNIYIGPDGNLSVTGVTCPKNGCGGTPFAMKLKHNGEKEIPMSCNICGLMFNFTCKQ